MRIKEGTQFIVQFEEERIHTVIHNPLAIKTSYKYRYNRRRQYKSFKTMRPRLLEILKSSNKISNLVVLKVVGKVNNNMDKIELFHKLNKND